jgi:hypothetical protein
MGLYLESMFGKDVCTVSHIQFGRGYNICLGRLHQNCWNRNSDCCEFGCHRGHLIVIKINKRCCNTRFATAFEMTRAPSKNDIAPAISETMSWILSSWDKTAFLKKHGIPDSYDYHRLFEAFAIHNPTPPNKRVCI